jgi:hypothetical protein
MPSYSNFKVLVAWLGLDANLAVGLTEHDKVWTERRSMPRDSLQSRQLAELISGLTTDSQAMLENLVSQLLIQKRSPIANFEPETKSSFT